MVARLRCGFAEQVPLVETLPALLALGPRLVAECAGHAGLLQSGPGVLRAGIDLVVASVGALADASLEKALAGVKGFKEIRGQGLMIGIDLKVPCSELMGRAADAGLLISVTADSVIRLVPPLIMSIAEADEVVAVLVPLIRSLLAEKGLQ